MERAVRYLPLWDPLLPERVSVLAIGEGVGLREEVAHQLIVRGKFLPVDHEVMLGLDETNEVTRHRLPHVEKLEETATRGECCAEMYGSAQGIQVC
jgi:hypothetical protein